MVEIIGDDLSNRLRDVSLSLYEKGVEIAEQRGIIIADTKFEFGLDPDGNGMTHLEEYLQSIAPPGRNIERYLQILLE